MEMALSDATWSQYLSKVARSAEAAGVFAEVAAESDRLDCQARSSAAPAWYRLVRDAGVTWVALVTPDRWLSQSIEQDLVHTGDKLNELLEEELAELGANDRAGSIRVEHFRSEDKLFTFRTPLSDSVTPEECARWILAYEACFRRLGDMEAGQDD